MTKKIPPPLPSGNPEKRNNGVQINDSKITYWFIPPEIGALQISLLQKNILGVVATFTRNGGECWATDVQFGEAFQWSRQKINSAINGMVAAGWLRKDVTRLSNGTTPRRLWLASPPIPLSPTVTSSTPNATDLVTHGDYPCHLGGLPLSPTVTTLVTHGDTNSNIIKKEKVIKEIVADAPTPTDEYSLILGEPQDSEVVQESDSLKELIEVSEAPPIPAAPPKTTRKSRKGAEVPFPLAEYWQGVTPSLVKWAVDNGVAESVAPKWVAQKIDDMNDSAAAKGYRFIDWAAAFRKWYRKELPKDDGIEADLRKASQYVFLSAKGGEGEKPVPSSAVWPAINKAIRALGGKEYLAGLANISEEWKDKKLTELKKFARDHLEGA